MYMLRKHAILVKIVLMESMLETVLFYGIPMLLLSLVCLDIELHSLKYGYEILILDTIYHF